MASPLDTYPGTPKSLREQDGYVAGYWLGSYHPADARKVLAQPWQSAILSGQGQYFWHRVGIEDSLAGVPSRLTTSGVLNARTDGAASEAYTDGYQLAQQDPREAQQEILSVSSDLSGDSTSFWRFAGMRDALAGTTARSDLRPAEVVVRKAPAYVPKPSTSPGVFVPAPPAPPPPANTPWAPAPSTAPVFKYLELVAELPVIGKIPFDLAVGVRKLSNGSSLASLLNGAVQFRITGAGAADGFGLSGPGGPIAQRVAAMIADGTLPPDPRAFGLRAWVGTRAQGAIRMLNLTTLRQLSLA